MLRFLRVKRRQGRPIRWIAERLGLDLLRVVAMAVNQRLTVPTSYRGRRCKAQATPELAPLGPANDIADDNLCRWIEADPTGPWAMCARPALEGYAYCPHHKQRAYIPRKPPLLRSNVAYQQAVVMAGRSNVSRQQTVVMAGQAKRDPATQESHAQTHTPSKPASNPLGGRVKPGHDDEEGAVTP